MADDLRIAIIGQAAFGKDVLAALADNSENIVGVFCPPDREGRPADPIKQEAEERGIPVFQFRRMRRKRAIEAFLELNADLCVMAFVTDIVPDEILEAPDPRNDSVSPFPASKASWSKFDELAYHLG